MDLWNHLMRLMAFSRATFGPGAQTQRIVDHLRKELIEVETSDGAPEEWTDVVILALDGLWRSVRTQNPRSTHENIANRVVAHITLKQGVNEQRDWPDWRTAPSDKAIEHVREKSEVRYTDVQVDEARRANKLIENEWDERKRQGLPALSRAEAAFRSEI